MTDDLPDWYIRALQYKALRAETIAVPPDEPTNVVSFIDARIERLGKMIRERKFRAGLL